MPIEYQADDVDVQDYWDKLFLEGLQKIEEELREIERLTPVIPPPSSADEEFDYSEESDLIHTAIDSESIKLKAKPERGIFNIWIGRKVFHSTASIQRWIEKGEGF
jgi:hypothetical protein